jgi:hypothetical protein
LIKAIDWLLSKDEPAALESPFADPPIDCAAVLEAARLRAISNPTSRAILAPVANSGWRVARQAQMHVSSAAVLLRRIRVAFPKTDAGDKLWAECAAWLTSSAASVAAEPELCCLCDKPEREHLNLPHIFMVGGKAHSR